MKNTYFRKTGPLLSRGIPAGIAMAVAVTLTPQEAGAQVLMVDLQSASEFAVLAGAGITIAGPVNSTIITGDIGTFPTTTVTGVENLILNGTNHGGNAVTQQGKLDLDNAYTDAAGRMPTTNYGAVHELGGSTLTSGVYNGPSSFSVTGTLTLDGGGDSDSVWIFQAGSTLTTASMSNIELINGAKASNVFWQVGSSATLGTNSVFEGTILAQTSITMNTGADLTGRALAIDGAVTLDNNTILVPEVGSTLLFGAGLLTLAMRRRRSSEIFKG